VFAGRVGTGFSDKVLASLCAKFQKLRVQSCPFVNLPEKSKGRWGLGITPAVMKRCDWLKPVLVAQVKFTEWTNDNQLRQPVFHGLRTDKEGFAKAAGVSFRFLKAQCERSKPAAFRLTLLQLGATAGASGFARIHLDYLGVLRHF
jgi:hypothetical protein